MEKISGLLASVNDLKKKYDFEKEKTRFNIFTAMYKDNEEVRLHSRFISYLLSPTSGHGMNSIFLEIFIREVLKLKEEEFEINNCEVIPNEFIKKEEDEIDIFIKNKIKKQAIIIENKLDAKDSNHFHKTEEGFKGQLERYYNETKNKGYFDKSIFVFFLTKYRPVSNESLGILIEKRNWKGTLFYGNEIREWLEKCISQIPPQKILVKEFIQQYLNLIDSMTNNDISKEVRLELKDKIAQNIESTKFLINNFKHVKWHTVHEFWVELNNEMEKNFKNVKIYPEKIVDFNKVIDAVTHNNKNQNHGLHFDFEDGTTGYISGQNNLSWGILNKGWFTFENSIIENICFSEFSSANTYKLIDKSCMKNTISLIVLEIKDEMNRNFFNIRDY